MSGVRPALTLLERLHVDGRAGRRLSPSLFGEPLAPFHGGVGVCFGFEHVAKGLGVGCLVDVRLGDHHAVSDPARLSNQLPSSAPEPGFVVALEQAP
jgi:hypothetical protein